MLSSSLKEARLILPHRFFKPINLELYSSFFHRGTPNIKAPSGLSIVFFAFRHSPAGVPPSVCIKAAEAPEQQGLSEQEELGEDAGLLDGGLPDWKQ